MVKPLLTAGEGGERKQIVKGIAHITGGGLVDNVARILPDDVTARFRSDDWRVPPIFTLIQEQGGIERNEMFHVFNMGIGMVLVISPGDADGIAASIPEARIIGEVVEGRGQKPVVIT